MGLCDKFQVAQSQFHFDLFKNTTLARASESIVYSPLGISFALIMVFLGANNETKEKTKNKMLLKNFGDRKILFCLKKTFNTLNSLDEKNLNILNNIYVDNDVTIKQNFFDRIKYFKHANFQKINFNDREKAAEEINNFIANKTNNNILNAINPSSMNSDTRLILLNLINFEALWVNQFDKIVSQSNNFFIDNNNIIQLDMMTQEKNFKIVETDKFQIIALPYKVNKSNINNHYGVSSYKSHNNNDEYLTEYLKMYIILPNQTLNLNDFMNNLTYKNFYDMIDLVNNKDKELVEILMPKFSITNNLDAFEIEKKAGINEFFEKDLSEIDNNSPLKISKILQKAFIEVIESGTKASTISLMYAEPLSPKRSKNFIANHPFMYLIADKDKNILFNGVFRGT